MIADKLVELRTKRGVTQEDVAQSLSVSNKTVSKWENGTSEPDLSMLVGLSAYYGVTTDTLLGLSEGENKKQDTADELRSLIDGLDRREAILKVFEIAKTIVPVMAPDGEFAYRDDPTDWQVFPPETSVFSRNMICRRDFFEFSASSENVNIAVMMLNNKADFAWLNDPDKQKEIVKIFGFLSHEDVLSVLYFIHSTACSDSFTADYIASHTGVPEERVFEILDEFCRVGDCRVVTAHLPEGEVKVYECFGDGVILSLIALAFEWKCGKKNYEYCYGGPCKMIGGK